MFGLSTRATNRDGRRTSRKCSEQFAAAAVAIGVLGLLPTISQAQGLERSRAIASSDVLSQISLFNYREHKKSELLFRATPVISTGEGSADIQYESGNATISAGVKHMPPPALLGPYTTYVLWALTPDGRASNEGVLAGSEGGSGAVETQHPASQFALIVTAEPHFAVSAPSTMVVLYNVGKDVRGAETKIASLFERADYAALKPIAADDRPIELIQAEYSLAIAGAAGAKEFVPNQYSAAEAKLLAARTAWSSKKSADRNSARSVAREATILGEDARRAGLVARADADAKAQRDAAAQAAAAAERERAAQAAAEQHAGSGRARKSRSARSALESIEYRAADSRIRARAHLRDRRRAVRNGHGESEPAGARESREILRHRRIVSGAPLHDRGAYRQRRLRADERRALVATRDQRARLPTVARSPGLEHRRSGLRPEQARRRQRDGRRPRAQPPRRDRDLGRAARREQR
jgi:hypothetical protein